MADMVRSGTDTPIDFWKNTRSWLLIRGSVSEGIEDNGQGGVGEGLWVLRHLEKEKKNKSSVKGSTRFD